MPFNLIRRLGLAALFCMAAPCWAAAQTGLPAAPCGDQAPTPAYAPEHVPPAAGVWQGAALREAGWQPPPCLGWTGDSRLVVTLASTFRSDLSVDQLVARLASISSYPGVKYWSISHQEWRPIAVEAAIVGAPAASGFDYSERGDLNGTSTYRFRVIEKSAEGAVVASENVAPIRILIVTAFAAERAPARDVPAAGGAGPVAPLPDHAGRRRQQFAGGKLRRLVSQPARCLPPLSRRRADRSRAATRRQMKRREVKRRCDRPVACDTPA